jgi:hypothetical protein
MPVIYREDGSTAWGMIAAVLVVVIMAVGAGVFMFSQSQPAAVVERGSTTIIQPSATQSQPSPAVIPFPVQGPAGPAGMPGASGSPGQPGAAGAAGPQGQEGTPAPAPEPQTP